MTDDIKLEPCAINYALLDVIHTLDDGSIVTRPIPIDDPCDEINSHLMYYDWMRCAIDQGDKIKTAILRAVINGHFGKLVPDPRTPDWLAACMFDNDPCDHQEWAIKEHQWYQAKKYFATGASVYLQDPDRRYTIMSEAGPECVMPRNWELAMRKRKP